jgi:hypothetical protein
MRIQLLLDIAIPILIMLSAIWSWNNTRSREQNKHKRKISYVNYLPLVLIILLGVAQISKTVCDRHATALREENGKKTNLTLQTRIEELKKDLRISESRSQSSNALAHLRGIPGYEPVNTLRQIVDRTAQPGNKVPREEIFHMMLIIVQKGWQLEYPSAHFWCQWLSAEDLKQSPNAATLLLWINEQVFNTFHESNTTERLKVLSIVEKTLCYALNSCRTDLFNIYQRLEMTTDWLASPNWPNYARIILSYCTIPLTMPDGVFWWSETRDRWQSLKEKRRPNEMDLSIIEISIQNLGEKQETIDFYHAQSGDLMLEIKTAPGVTLVFKMDLRPLFENPLRQWRFEYSNSKPPNAMYHQN